MFSFTRCRLLLVISGAWWTSWSFKLTDIPSKLSKVDDGSTLQLSGEDPGDVDGTAKGEDIPSGAGGFPQNPDAVQSGGHADGFGAIAQNLNFLLVKVAQLEAVAEMQDTEIKSLRASNLKHRIEIESLKKASDKAHALSQPDFTVLLEEMEPKHPDARLSEATEVMKRVLHDHQRQRETGTFHHNPESLMPEAGLAEERQEGSQDSASNETARWGPVGNAFNKATGGAIDFAKDPVGSLKQGWEAAKNPTEKIKWATDQVKKHAITTVSQATEVLRVLGVPGFKDFSGSCRRVGGSTLLQERSLLSRRSQHSRRFFPKFHHNIIKSVKEAVKKVATKVKKYEPSASFGNKDLSLEIPGISCSISLVGQKTASFGFPATKLTLPLPGPLKTIGGASTDVVKGAIYFFHEIVKCEKSNADNMLKCIGNKIRKLQPPLGFLPKTLRDLKNGLPTRLAQVAKGDVKKILPTKLIQVADGDVMKIVPDELQKVVNGDIKKLLPSQLQQVVDGDIKKLLPRPLRQVVDGDIKKLLPKQLRQVVDGDIKKLLPGKVRSVASGDIMKLVPKQLQQVVSGDINKLLPSQLQQVVSGDINKLLPSQLQQVVKGDLLGLLDVNNPVRKVADGKLTDLFPGPLQMLGGGNVNSVETLLTMGNELMKCSKPTSQGDLIQCLGYKIVGSIPPLNFLNRLGEIFAEFIESFAKVASAVATQAMKGGKSLLQTAATSDFPSAGAPPMVHHRGSNLMITKHTQQAPSGQAELLQELAAAKAKDDDDEDEEDPSAISWSFGDYGPQTRTLVTQFNGRETSTGSCLAFAPRNKTGSDSQATQQDWQATSEDAFIKLEPWAVPCGNKWMKDNWNKWQGYSFYTSDIAIEKCVTVTFALNMQPVVAFVGGIQFDLLPNPLAEVDTQVCWPKTQPGGLDLSVLRTVIKSNGVLLFSRTLRLAKRFGKGTDFVADNINGGHQTSRSFFGVSDADGESGSAIAAMKRSALLETNRSQAQAKSQVEESLYWKLEEDDSYVASIEYGNDLHVNMTSELRGQAAGKRMSAIQAMSETSEDEEGAKAFSLFSFRNSGMINFEVSGLLKGNLLQLGLQMGFGPTYQSPKTTIPLVNLADQFALILAAMPNELVSLESRARAIASLKDFSIADVQDVKKQAQVVKVADSSGKKSKSKGEGDWSFSVNAPPTGSGAKREAPEEEEILKECQGRHVKGTSCAYLKEADCDNHFVTTDDGTMQCAWLDGRCLTMGSSCMTTTSTTTTTVTTTSTRTSTTTTSTTTQTTTSTRTTTTTSTFTTTTTTMLFEADLEDGLQCSYFYNKAKCSIPDLGSMTPSQTVVVPRIWMEKSKKFPGLKQSWKFCMRCTGRIVTRKSGDYKFFLSSDDGSIMYLNGEKIVDNNGCHGERERSSRRKTLESGQHDIVVDMCEIKGGEAFKLRYQGPDSGQRKVVVPASVLKHEFKPLADGLECTYFYDQAKCTVPDLGSLNPGQTLIVPEINMEKGKFPDARQSSNFCMRCTGQLVARKAGKYRFHLTSDDGSLLYLNGEKIVDNNGCHGAKEKRSHRKSLSFGTHHLVVDMCEVKGGERFRLRYEGPDTDKKKVTVPVSALKHEVKPLSDGLECDYFYNKAKCDVPDLGSMTPSQTVVVPEISFSGNGFPKAKQTWNYCMRCTGHLITRTPGDYKFHLSSDDGSLLRVNREVVVDNDGCHGEKEKSSSKQFLSAGAHYLSVDMCEIKGGQVFKMRYEGPDTGKKKVTVPAKALKHELKMSDGLECDYFYRKARCDVPDLKSMTPAHSAILPEIFMAKGRFPNVFQHANVCMRCTGHLVTRSSGNYKFFLSSDDGSLLYVNGEKAVDNNGCHGERERSSQEMLLAKGTHKLEVSMCEKHGGEAFKMRYQGPDTGRKKVTVPSDALKHELKDLADGLECDYFYNQAKCAVPDLGKLKRSHSEIVSKIFMENGKFPNVRQRSNVCIRCAGHLITRSSGDYKFFLSSDDGSLMYLNGEKIVDNDGCHGERERSSGKQFLSAGAHYLVVDMCEKKGGEAFKMRYEGPDTDNKKKTIPASVLMHEPKAPEPAAGPSMVAWFRSEDASSAWRSVVGAQTGKLLKGRVSRKVESGHGAKKPVKYITGGTGAVYDFGKIMKRDFTICSVTRYLEGGKTGRILQSKPPNFLHGHHSGRTGVAHYSRWVTDKNMPRSNDWTVLCGSREGIVLRGDGKKNIATKKGHPNKDPFHLYINKGYRETSDFAVMEVIVWDRGLTEDEMRSTMNYLNHKLAQGSQ